MKKVITYISLLLGLSSFAQTGNLVFDDTIMHTITIETSLPDWFATLDQEWQNNITNPDLYPEIYHQCDVTFDGTILNNCGFREKGNASNSLVNFGKKKPLKISFDEFVSQELDGLKKMNLNNFTNDPSLLHDVICFKLMRDQGITAPRTAFAKVFVNGEYIGLYLIIENVDKRFLKFAYGSASNDGNLYKTDRGASVTLDWLGPESQGYKDQGLKLTTNESVDDWSILIEFINNLNNNHASDFKTYLENNFDVHTYLKILAIEKCVRSWDSYWGGGNNFFMYEHPDGKIRWIPWDMNETFQDIKQISGTSIWDGYLIPANKFDERPLLARIFEIDEFKNEYLNDVCDLIQSKFTLDYLGQYILDRHNLIDKAYQEDTYKYNSYEEFKYSLTDWNEDAVSLSQAAYVLRITYPGIYPFIQSQREWAVEQMNGWDHNCNIADNGIYNLNIFPNPTNNYVNILNDAGGFEYAQFKLYDFQGRLYRTTTYNVMSGPYYTLQLEGVPQGIYLLIKNSADGKMGRAKIVVK